MIRQIFLICAISLCGVLLIPEANCLLPQDRGYALGVIDTLSSPEMHGRGYVSDGAWIASDYIEKEFINMGIGPPGSDYFQEFSMAVNTFPDTVMVWIDGKEMIPGSDFVVHLSSSGVDNTFGLFWFLKDTSGIPRPQGDFGMMDISDKVMVTDVDRKEFQGDHFGAAGIIFLTDNKVWWHISDGGRVNDFFSLQMLRESIPENSDSIRIRVNNVFHPSYPVRNVVSVLPGKNDTAKSIVIGAHYDHLGRMGSKVFFPGANDNASGVALILDLARHFSREGNTPDRTLIFVAFAGEEAGLKGSSFFVENPPQPLSDIRFMLNFDMVGSGSEGVKVVNGSVFEKEFSVLQEINSRNNYLPSVNERGEAANSDHYPFCKSGVPSFFIYTLGKECAEYHNTADTPENTPLTEYEDLFRLITDFIQRL